MAKLWWDDNYEQFMEELEKDKLLRKDYLAMREEYLRSVAQNIVKGGVLGAEANYLNDDQMARALHVALQQRELEAETPPSKPSEHPTEQHKPMIDIDGVPTPLFDPDFETDTETDYDEDLEDA
jgi:hypothetical protein